MSAFVGTKTCEETELKTLLTEQQTEKSYYFLRWHHAVSGFISEVPDKLSPTGQLFDAEKELRWQWKQNQFHLLLLSQNDSNPDFLPLGGNWQTKDVNSILRSNETRFPHRIKGQAIKNLAQRYFMDAETAIIHFVALTLTENHEPS